MKVPTLSVAVFILGSTILNAQAQTPVRDHGPERWDRLPRR